MSKYLSDIEIGADPEFAFLLDGEIQTADDYVRGVRTNFGVDGCGAIAELRPQPSYNPLEVVKNIQIALASGYQKFPKIRKFEWRAGGCFYSKDHGEDFPLGGHIHFGRFDLRKYIEREDRYDDDIEQPDKLIDVLDDYLAQTIILLEDVEGACKRRQCNYGLLAGARPNSHGFEYRTLSSWVGSPYVSAGVLCLAQAIAHGYFKKEIKPLDDRDYGSYFHKCDRAYFKRKFPRLRTSIQKLSLYKPYQKYIDFIFLLIEKNKTWNMKEDMKKAWGIKEIPIIEPAPKQKVEKLILPTFELKHIWGK